MRKTILMISAAALTLAAAAPAAAFQVTVGGRAGACSQYAKQGRTDDTAVEVCTQALAGEPLNRHDLAGTFVNRGAIYLLKGSREQAHADFQSALRVAPEMGEAMIGEGGYLISMERWPEAEQWITRGLQAGSEESEKGYYFRGIARWGQNNFKGAYLDFRKASELKPDWSLPREQMAHFTVTPAAG